MGGFYEGVIVGLRGCVHCGHAGGEMLESQRDDGAGETHDFHDHGESGAVFELLLGTAVAVVGGHGADAGYAVADVADDVAAFASESS